MSKRPASESALAAVVVAWLESLEADVYPEVEHRGSIADIVSVRGPELTVIETKTSWSLALISQALNWRLHATRVYMAGPPSKTTWQVRQIAQELGIGMLEVTTGNANAEYEYQAPRVRELVASTRWNRRPAELRSKLRPQHKTAAPAGTASGGRWTPFRDTCQQIVEIVRAFPGCTIKQVVDQTKGHYATPASARSAIAHWVQVDRIPGVRAEYDGNKLRLYADESVKRRMW